MVQQIQNTLVIIRRKQVQARTGLGRSTLYDAIKAGTFPAPVNLGPRAVGWIEAEINAWIASRIEQSRKSAA